MSAIIIFIILLTSIYMLEFDLKYAVLPNIRRLNDHLDVPLNGYMDVNGYYYTTLHVGNPPQRFSVIVDTGSGLMSIPCQGCDCGTHLHQPFDYTKSSTSKSVTCSDKPKHIQCTCSTKSVCTWQLAYLEGSSYSGIYYEDDIFFGPDNETFSLNYRDKKFRYVFGCHLTETNLFRSQFVDGIMGISPSNYPFFSLLKEQGFIKSMKFSLCIHHKGGVFSLNEVPGYTILSKISSVRFTTPFRPELQFISVNDQHTLPFHQSVLFDSGTTVTYLPSNDLNALVNELDSICNTTNTCLGNRIVRDKELFCFTSPQFNTFPIVKLYFDNTTILIAQPDNYFWNFFGNFGPSTYCLSIYTGNPVIGSNLMRDHHISFDLEKYTIGIAQANCNNIRTPMDYNMQEKGVNTINKNDKDNKSKNDNDDMQAINDKDKNEDEQIINDKGKNEDGLIIHDKNNEDAPVINDKDNDDLQVIIDNNNNDISHKSLRNQLIMNCNDNSDCNNNGICHMNKCYCFYSFIGTNCKYTFHTNGNTFLLVIFIILLCSGIFFFTGSYYLSRKRKFPSNSRLS